MSMRVARLDDVCEVNPRAPKDLPDDELASFLPMAAVSENGHIQFEEQRAVAEVKKGYTYFERDDVLVAKITPCFENGKATRTKELRRPFGFASTEFHVLRASEAVDQSYLFHMIWNSRFREVGSKNMTGSAGQKRVPADFLKRLEIPLPPLDEQRRIAAILDKANALRRNRKRALELQNSLIQSVFSEMFGSRKDPVYELREVVKKGTIVTYGIVQAGPEFFDGVPYIRTGDLVDGEINASGLRRTDPAIAARFSRSRVEAGDIVMSIRATVGTTAVVPTELEGANLTQGTARISPGEYVSLDYLLEFFRTESTQLWIAAQVKGATFLEITLGRLRELPVVVPPKELQDQFSRIVQKIRRGRDAGVRQAHSTDHLFSSLQHRAFSGQL